MRLVRDKATQQLTLRLTHSDSNQARVQFKALIKASNCSVSTFDFRLTQRFACLVSSPMSCDPVSVRLFENCTLFNST